MTMFRIGRDEVKCLKESYPVGTRIVCNFCSDPYKPIAAGTEGTVRVVDDMGTVHCNFDNGRSFGLIPGEDSFSKI